MITAEHLQVPIEAEDVPQQALGAYRSCLILAEMGNRRVDPLALLASIKDGLYPRWKNYDDLSPRLPKSLEPFWGVDCDTPQQARLAEMLRPEIGDVQIRLRDESPEERSETARPLVERVRSFIRTHTPEAALSGTAAIAYGTTILSTNIAFGTAIRSMIPDSSTVVENYIGTGLIAAGTLLLTLVSRPRSRE